MYSQSGVMAPLRVPRCSSYAVLCCVRIGCFSILSPLWGLVWALCIVGVRMWLGWLVELLQMPLSPWTGLSSHFSLVVWSSQSSVYVLRMAGLFPLILGFPQSSVQCSAHKRCLIMDYNTRWDTPSSVGHRGVGLEGLGSLGWPAPPLARYWPPCSLGRSHLSLWRAVRGCVWGYLNYGLRAFPGGAVIKTSPSNAWGAGSIPGQRARIPHAWGPKNQNIKQKQYCNKLNKDFKNGPHQKKKKIIKINKFKKFTLISQVLYCAYVSKISLLLHIFPTD